VTRSWLTVVRGDAPLVVTFPHAGTDLADVGHQFTSEWLARVDTDWYIDELYEGAAALGATLIGTRISRSVIDLNRDPSGRSLYPGQATTDLCPGTTFDGESLYSGQSPDAAEVERRRRRWFDPYHRSLQDELARLRQGHARVVLYDAHSIRSRIPRLFQGDLPQFNIGTNNDAACAPDLTRAVARACAASGLGHVCNGRFLGGWTTRRHGRPDSGIHALQMELAMRGYLDEPETTTPQNWPPAFDAQRGAAMMTILMDVLKTCLDFALHSPQET
jgi:N-formylglutamate deformylase